MTARRRLSCWLAAVCAILASSDRSFGQGLLSQVPEDAIAFVAVNRLAETSDKVGRVAKALEVNIPDLLALFKLSAGVQRGLDEKASVLLVLMPDAKQEEDAEIGRPAFPGVFPVAFLPVTDYDQFVTQFGAQDPQAEIIRVPIAGAPALIGRKGSFALVAEPEREEALRAILKAEPGKSAAQLKRLEAWVGENDVAFGATPRGVQWMVENLLGLIQQQRKFFEEEGLPDEPVFEQFRQTMDNYASLLKFIQSEIPALAGGVRVLKDNDLHTGYRFLLAREGELDRVMGLFSPSKDALGPLPDEPFVIAAGGSWSPALGELLLQWSMQAIRSNPLMYGFGKLTDEDARKLAESSLGAVKIVRSMSLMMSVGEEKESFYERMLMTVQVDDAALYLAESEKSYRQWNELAERAEEGKAATWELQREKIGGAETLKASIEFGKLLEAQAGFGMEEISKAMFGPDGKLRMYLAAVDGQTIIMAYSEKRLKTWIEAYKQKSPRLGESKKLVAGRAKLPQEAVWVGYLSPDGAVTAVSHLMKSIAEGLDVDIPPLPAVPPLAGSLSYGQQAATIDLIVPIATVKGIYDYARSLARGDDDDPFN